jgi:serine/threonine-protein kinase
MSPEQASGGTIDFRSDQFSFGPFLYEPLTGQRAFERPTAAETLSAIIRDDPPPLICRGRPAAHALDVERCLAKSPGRSLRLHAGPRATSPMCATTQRSDGGPTAPARSRIARREILVVNRGVAPPRRGLF